MPGLALTQAGTVLCAHGGQAQPTAPLPRVLMSGSPAVGQSAPYVVAGCPFVAGTVPSPCVTDTWMTGALRVRSGGIPLLLQDSQSVCAPNGTPSMVISPGQARVMAQ
ncbi:hypothetical protein [Nocardioides taihuensis]|uniref:DUF4280 domain-containing protein n=1 Tax=Nocardioides taihuensis TaxID=1835606 RepID=A0ABW0BE78_9ACTN